MATSKLLPTQHTHTPQKGSCTEQKEHKTPKSDHISENRERRDVLSVAVVRLRNFSSVALKLRKFFENEAIFLLKPPMRFSLTIFFVKHFYKV